MGILRRLETVIRSYINNGSSPSSSVRSGNPNPYSADPDLNEAYEELDDLLYGKDKEQDDPFDAKDHPSREQKKTNDEKPIPDEIKRDFAELGLSPDATLNECRKAYKKLLKIHHPDLHAGHEANSRKATMKMTAVNASYERLIDWYTKTKS